MISFLKTKGISPDKVSALHAEVWRLNDKKTFEGLHLLPSFGKVASEVLTQLRTIFDQRCQDRILECEAMVTLAEKPKSGCSIAHCKKKLAEAKAEALRFDDLLRTSYEKQTVELLNSSLQSGRYDIELKIGRGELHVWVAPTFGRIPGRPIPYFPIEIFGELYSLMGNAFDV